MLHFHLVSYWIDSDHLYVCSLNQRVSWMSAEGHASSSVVWLFLHDRMTTWRLWAGCISRWPGPTRSTPTSTSRCSFTKWTACQTTTRSRSRGTFTNEPTTTSRTPAWSEYTWGGFRPRRSDCFWFHDVCVLNNYCKTKRVQEMKTTQFSVKTTQPIGAK